MQTQCGAHLCQRFSLMGVTSGAGGKGGCVCVSAEQPTFRATSDALELGINGPRGLVELEEEYLQTSRMIRCCSETTPTKGPTAGAREYVPAPRTGWTRMRIQLELM